MPSSACRFDSFGVLRSCAYSLYRLLLYKNRVFFAEFQRLGRYRPSPTDADCEAPIGSPASTNIYMHTTAPALSSNDRKRSRVPTIGVQHGRDAAIATPSVLTAEPRRETQHAYNAAHESGCICTFLSHPLTVGCASEEIRNRVYYTVIELWLDVVVECTQEYITKLKR